MQLYLENKLKDFFVAEQSLFQQVMALRGEPFRHLDGRLTQRIQLGQQTYFIKQHYGVGWREILKNLAQWRWPVISAKSEWLAIAKLKTLGVNTPVVTAYGECGMNPATLQSFILMEELKPVISLEDLCRDWKQTIPNYKLKQKLIMEVARIARQLHVNGMNHRDFYICHFLLDISQGYENINTTNLTLYLIDLHRAQIRRSTPERWMIKDLACLFFSSKDIGLTQRDLLRFIKQYRQQTLRDILATEENFWQKVKLRGSTYRDHTK